MSLGINRRRIYGKGLGRFYILQLEPTLATTVTSLGLIKSFKLTDITTDIDSTGDNGLLLNSIEGGRLVGAEVRLMQTSAEEIAAVRALRGTVNALRYCGVLNEIGSYQYHWFPRTKPVNPVDLNYDGTIRELAGQKFKALSGQDESPIVPHHAVVDMDAELNIDGLELFFPFYDGLNYLTASALDYSIFGRNATINSDYATIWQGSAGAYFLRLDGVNDVITIGNYCNDNASKDYVIEMLVRVMGADGTLQEILSKKSADAHEAGFRLVRNTGNKIEFKLSDGSASVTLTSAANVLTNVWTHVAIVIDRNGNGQIYINGVANGNAASVASLGTGTNTGSLVLGSFASGFGQIDIAMFRFHQYLTGGLPTNLTTMMPNHYNAEKARVGL